jgi:SAM-dependent MidA family methyltransferase
VSLLPLEGEIAHRILQEGGIGVDVFHHLALFHPQWGYYKTSQGVGYGRDFTTAPEITPLFGEVVGAFCVNAWMQNLSRAASFSLVELGPGRGTLMAEILRVGRLSPGFLRAAQLVLIETNPQAREEQQKILHPFGCPIQWHENLEALDTLEGPCIVLANEFFDTFPIQQKVFSHQGQELPERRVHWGPQGFYLSPLPPECRIREESPQQEAAFKKVLHLLKRQGGVFWITDYGPGTESWGDSWQGVRDGQRVCPLSHVGQTDLSAHVPFHRLCQWAQGLDVYGPLTQRAFLLECGLAKRLEKLRGTTPSRDKRALLEAGVMRLVHPLQMGELFKTMVVQAP